MPTDVPIHRSEPGKRSARHIPFETLALVFAFCLPWIALGAQNLGEVRTHDFLSIYTAASLALEGNFAHMHSPDVLLNRERRFAPNTKTFVPFPRLPFYALALAPLALLPFGIAFWFWLGLQSTTLIVCWTWALRRLGPDALVFGALYLPAALGVAKGQDSALMLVIVIAIYSLADRQRDFWSGAALGLGLIKFHLFLLWPLALLIQRRWRIIGGACAVVAAELFLSLLLVGRGGMVEYFQLIRGTNNGMNPSPELMINLNGLEINFGLRTLVIRTLLAATVVLLVSIACWRAPLWRWIAAVSTGSLLVAPHIYLYDAGLLLAPLWLAIFMCPQKWTRIAATFACTPIPFLLALFGTPWAAAAPLTLLLFLAGLASQFAAQTIPSVVPLGRPR